MMRNPIRIWAGVLVATVLLGAHGCGRKSSGGRAALPGPPLAVTAYSQASGEILLDWPPVADVPLYNVYWSTSPGVSQATGNLIASVAPPHLLTGLSNGTTHYLAVSSILGSYESALSVEAAALPLAVPAFTSVTSGTSSIRIEWSPVVGADSYDLYWSTSPGVTGATGTLIPGPSSPFTHGALPNGTTHYYIIVASNAVGGGATSSASAEVSATPIAAPTGVAASAGDSQVRVTWSSVNGATSYNIYGDTVPGVTKASPNPLVGVSSPHTYTGLANGTTYYFVVTALNATGESVESAEVSATPAAPPPPSPPNPVAAVPGDAMVTLSWGPVPGALSYNIYWDTVPGVTKVSGNPIIGVATTYPHSSLVNGTTYYYVVTSSGTGGEGVESLETSATPNPLLIGPPTGLQAIGGDGQITLTWNPVPGATDYHLYWATSPGVSQTTGTRIPSVLPPYIHGGLVNGTPHYYVVTAEDGAGEGPDSAEVSATPNRSGAPDPTFGGGGVVVHNNAAGASSDDVALALTVDGSGRILVTGYSANTSFYLDMVIWRITDSGDLDTTFNGQGWVVHDGAAGGAADDVGRDIVTDGTGRILVAGFSEGSFGDDDMVIWAYDDAGTLDPSFGSGGIVTHHNAAGGDGWDMGRGITLDASGKILVTGASYKLGSGDEMTIWRYDAAGVLDTSFGGTGFVLHGNAAGGDLDDEGDVIAVDPSGRIVVAGKSYGGPTHYDMVTWRYDSAGVLDAAFGQGGFTLHHNAAGGDNYDEGHGLGLDPSGRVLIAGESFSGTSSDMVLWAYDGAGILDPSFGSGGLVVSNNAAGGNGADLAGGMVLDGLGRILVGGLSRGASDDDMVIWRFDAAGSPDLTFGTAGVAVHDSAAGGGSHDGGEDITLDGSGRILVAGWSWGGVAVGYDMVVWRINP